MDLASRYEALKNEQPRLRAREAAAHLDVSEAELLAIGLGSGTVRLAAPFGPLLQALSELGELMALTRNEAAVIEKEGVYEPVEVGPHASLVLGKQIDLRLFLSQWALGFATVVDTPRGARRGLQFFDATGEAVHKVYLPLGADAATFDGFVARFAHADQRPEAVVVTPPRAPSVPGQPEAAGLLAGWRALRDTHDFFGLLRKHGATRQQALHLAQGEFTWAAPTSAATTLLERAAQSGLPIMVFVGNHGCIEIHTGPVHKVKAMGDWINVLDEGFNLHLRTDLIAEAWVVRKPTVDGDVTSLELLDAQGDVIVQFFGERKPGRKEDLHWRALAHGLAQGDVAAK